MKFIARLQKPMRKLMTISYQEQLFYASIKFSSQLTLALLEQWKDNPILLKMST